LVDGGLLAAFLTDEVRDLAKSLVCDGVLEGHGEDSSLEMDEAVYV